jgi:hypothetical protein
VAEPKPQFVFIGNWVRGKSFCARAKTFASHWELGIGNFEISRTVKLGEFTLTFFLP